MDIELLMELSAELQTVRMLISKASSRNDQQELKGLFAAEDALVARLQISQRRRANDV